MPIYQLGEYAPEIHPDAYVHPDAVVIGRVTIGADSSIWPGAVLRGDTNTITIGERTSIQDNTVVHTAAQHPTSVGNDCVVGHVAHLEGCRVEDGVLIGSGSVVLHDAVVGTGALVAVNSVVRNRMVVPPGALALGVPAQIRPDAADSENILRTAAKYVRDARHYREQLVRLD